MDIMNQISLQSSIGGLYIGDMLIVLFSFLILVFLVRKFAWGPVMDMMKQREEHVANEILAAEKNRESADKLFAESETRLEEIKQEARSMIEDAKQLGKQQEEQIIQTAKAEAVSLKEAAQKDIQMEKERALQAVQDQVASLSVLIATKVIEKELNEADQEDLIADFVNQLGEGQ